MFKALLVFDVYDAIETITSEVPPYSISFEPNKEVKTFSWRIYFVELNFFTLSFLLFVIFNIHYKKFPKTI